jgi:hypothetical protein
MIYSHRSGYTGYIVDNKELKWLHNRLQFFESGYIIVIVTKILTFQPFGGVSGGVGNQYIRAGATHGQEAFQGHGPFVNPAF